MSSFNLLLFLGLLLTTSGQLVGNIRYEESAGDSEILTTESGRPIGDKWNLLTAGPRGPGLMQDIVFLEELSHFTRERIPERVVHAKGNGAYGYFEVTDDITLYTKAKVFDGIGKRTRVVTRFSITNGELGSADTVRDIRGFATRFFTEEGDWNLLAVHVPVFPIRDSILFPSFIHSQTNNPQSNFRDPNAFWDFGSLVPETTAAFTFLFGDRGIPLAYRFMDGFAINAFKLVNAADESVFCKFIFKTDQGIRNLTSEEATRLAGVDRDFQGRDLYEAIERGDYPSWTFYIQVMTEDEANNFRFNPFDATKSCQAGSFYSLSNHLTGQSFPPGRTENNLKELYIQEWPEEEFPLIRVGKLVLNENPINYFAEIEQLAFCPVRLVPGIEPSPDKVLQGRLFAYTDAQRYRLGVNFNQIPVNVPSRSPVRNYERNGFMTVNGNQGGGPHYYPNSYGGPQEHPVYLETPFEVCGTATRYNSSDDDNFSQARIFYEQMTEDQKSRLIQNIADSLSQAQELIQQRQLNNFRQVSEDFADRLTVGLTNKKQEMAQKEPDQEMAFSMDDAFDEAIKSGKLEGFGEGMESNGRKEFQVQTKFSGKDELGLQTEFSEQMESGDSTNLSGQDEIGLHKELYRPRPLPKNMRS